MNMPDLCSSCAQKEKDFKQFRKAAVAADTSIASTVGKDILLEGGNAVDAAIATLICSGLTSPQSMGIGGGFFMTIYNSGKDYSTFIDARETAPAEASSSVFDNIDAGQQITGPLSIAVPGEIKGYWYVHRKYGHLAWSKLFKKSIKYAEEGFPLPTGLHKALNDDKEKLLAIPALREMFFSNQTGTSYEVNEIIKMPQLARTLSSIAEYREDNFYKESFLDDIVQDLKDLGSVITEDDLTGYTVQEKQPVEITLNCGTRVISPSAPSGGPVLSLILNIMDGFKLTDVDIDSIENCTRTYHRFIEALKLAYHKCYQHCNDVMVDDGKLLEKLTLKDVADRLRSRIDDKKVERVRLDDQPATVQRHSTCTSHLSVLDEKGLAVSVTSTINSRFGSGLRGERTGIIFNNEMDDFSRPGQLGGIYSSPVNYVVPGKRPLSSMCPAILLDSSGKVTHILGAAGGSKITSTVAWIISHLLWFGKDLDQAINMPRLHFDYKTSTVLYEENEGKFYKTVIDNLRRMGHRLEVFRRGESIGQGIEVIGQMIHAKSDTRKGGHPDGI